MKLINHPVTKLQLDYLGHLENQIAKANSSKLSLSVLFFDIDNFSHYNNSLGYQAGDQILQTIAERISASLGKLSQLYQIDSDGFVFTLEEDKLEFVEKWADKVLAITSNIPTQPYWVFNTLKTKVTVSLVVVQYPLHFTNGVEFESLFPQAIAQPELAGCNTWRVYAPPQNKNNHPDDAPLPPISQPE